MMVSRLAVATQKAGTTGTIMTDSANRKNDGDLIEVSVKSQKGKFEGKFSETATVQAVITAAATKLGFDRADRLELALENDRSKPLDPNTPLGSLLHKNHDHQNEHEKTKLVFILTATGSGV